MTTRRNTVTRFIRYYISILNSQVLEHFLTNNVYHGNGDENVKIVIIKNNCYGFGLRHNTLLH
jgi:hypothetical protein